MSTLAKQEAERDWCIRMEYRAAGRRDASAAMRGGVSPDQRALESACEESFQGMFQLDGYTYRMEDMCGRAYQYGVRQARERRLRHLARKTARGTAAASP